jgi:glutamate/tyrosine decarboxylase-like PLP-dependent enzyme
MGSFDDHHAINAIARKYNMWHHVDACWGGFLVFSEKNRHLFDGSEKADSISTNPHKGMGVPQQSSYILTNNKPGALLNAFNSGAEYLFQHGEYSHYDIGDKTLQCGRKPDGLKTWLVFKKHGIEGLAKIADAAVEKAEYITKAIIAQPEKFEMINKPMAVNVCFAYTPPAYRNREYSYAARCRVHKKIYETMNNDGTLVIQHNPLEEFNLPNFFRLTLKNEKTTLADMDYILAEIDRAGSTIEFEADSVEDIEVNTQMETI